MRTFLRVTAENDEEITTEIWNGHTWTPATERPMRWEAYRVSFEDEPPYLETCVLVFSEGHGRQAEARVSCSKISVDALPTILKAVLELVDESNCVISLSLEEGIHLNDVRMEDLVTFNETGELPDRIFELADGHHDVFKSLLLRLGDTPRSDCLKIFGSFASGKALPGDIDVFVDAKDLASDEIKELSAHLMGLAKEFHGVLDPFILVNQTLYCRNDGSTGWIPARNADALRRAGEQGIALASCRMPGPILEHLRQKRTSPNDAPRNPKIGQQR